jgi:signal-transduction protein with cAMP-binding, CBS, and nucleotidyltransferase domain
MESKRPLTRSVLELRISEVQSLLDDAVSRKAFTDCAPLQDKLESLIRKRNDLPTINELKEAVRLAEVGVANAAARRDFAGAATAQVTLDKANERLKDTLQSEGDVDDSSSGKFSSRADLEIAISEVTKEIDSAIAKKEFNTATKYQAELEVLEGLRVTLPSVEEIEHNLSALKAKMEDAIKGKNFTKANSLQSDIEQLETKLEEEKLRMPSTPTNEEQERGPTQYINEKGEKITFESRYELENEITRFKALVQNAAMTKKFKEASENQRNLDELEKLKPLLPTALELRSELAKLKAEMEAAIQTKHFEKAEELHQSVEKLEKKLELEQKNSAPNTATPANPSHTAPTVVKTPFKKPLHDSTNTKLAVAASSSKVSKTTAKSSTNCKPVSRLRPKKPVISQTESSVLEIVQLMAAKHCDAAIITDQEGGLAGIVTDTDITRRLVARKLPPMTTCITDVMTANPSCVSMSDPATDALVTMVENHFRHLPVLDDNGAVVGVLDIAKCLNDAITQLERGACKGSSAAEEALNASLSGADGAQAAALRQLLGPLLSQALSGQTSPTLRTVLAGKPSTIVSPSTTIQDTGNKMAEARKAALVVDNGHLVGIFGFKDMMTRAVAKELPLDYTAVSTVMTPNPESVSPDTTVLEALQIMHENKFLTLPVCESNGRVIGVVDVMDCVYASGGADGWRSIFNQAMDCDDLTDIASVHSNHAGSVKGSIRSFRNTGKIVPPVSKLRPKAPNVCTTDDSVLSVAQMLASKRGDAAIITNSSGELAGIMTDTDVTRRLVAKKLPASTTSITDVMTANPSCVSMSDPATEALVTMVENHFRHLPVTDESGAVVGVLDIAKCLNDAITQLERSNKKSANAAEEALNASLGGAGGAQAAALRQLLGPLLSQALSGQTSPTLRTVLAGKPSTIVSPSTTIQDTGNKMAEARKAALVVEDGELVGIFGFKDMMTRAVAKELPLDYTAVSTVMTPNPESVSPDTTVLEALQIMHENKFLTLPVCESDGRVIGVVDVMDCVYASGGADGWRSIFNQAMDCDDLTDTASVHSNHAGSVKGSIRSSRNTVKIVPPVSKLRPKAPNVCTTDDSVLSVAQMLASKRGDAAIITNSSGELAGIMTDTDVTRRLVAKKLPASTTCITDVMTANPSCVSMSDPATEALVTMVENHFRHLPVLDDSGLVVGVLDIAKCLNDAITQLERSNKKSTNAAEEALNASLGGAGGAQAAALRQLLGPLLSQALSGQTSPTLRTVLAGKPSTIVSPSTTIQDTGNKMAEARKAALVVEDGELVGIFGFKDMMTRAVAKELPLDYTAVSTVMTPNPESVSPDTTVLEALQIMHENKFLTLPVCESNGSVIGVVDVMDCVYASGGADGWRSIFNQAMDCDDLSYTASVQRNKSVLDQDDDFSYDGNRMRSALMATSHPNNIPLQVHVGGGDQESTGESWTQINSANNVVYKVVDDAGHTYVIRAGKTIDSVTKALEGKVSNFDPTNIVFKYFDDEGDEILIKSDECVEEAVSSSILAGNKNVKLSMKSTRSSSKSNSLLLAGGAGLAAAVAFTVMVLLKPKKS